MTDHSKRTRIRFPTLEVYGARHGAAFGTSESPLTPHEKTIAKEVFEDSIDLDVVRIVRSPLVNAPTTLGNYIRVGRAPMSSATLIHELAHIWQFQSQGTAYISDSLYHQAKASIATGDRNAAYAVGRLVPGKSFHDYTAEQQAIIVETWFSDRRMRADAEMRKLIAEVRKARPLAESVRLQLTLEEAAFGSDMLTHRVMPPREVGDAGVPLIRIEF